MAEKTHRLAFLRHYWIDLIITVIAIIGVGVFASPYLLFPLFVLLVMEISFSFDNAVVNARVLERMSPLWQKLFLTVGILIAVFGMRFVFPIAIVAITAQISFGEVLALAIGDPDGYAAKLHDVHAMIAMFGGVYLLQLFLTFVFAEREIKWIVPVEKVLAKIGRIPNLSYILTSIFILVAGFTFGAAHQTDIILAGFMSMLTFMIVHSLSNLVSIDDKPGGKYIRHGWAAFALFMYLEVQDAAFSLDGVFAAFAITDSIILIAIGLGIGALFVRSMTVHLVKTKQLARLRYLDHGAHWAIGFLAVCMLVGVSDFIIPEYIVGLVGVIFIITAGIQSVVANRTDPMVNRI